MIIDRFIPFYGKHCETTAIGNLLKHCEIILSEPMLFGLGEGLSFIYWDSKQLGFPFLGGRIKQDLLTENLAAKLNLKLEVNETVSKAKAWDFVKNKIDRGQPVALKLDCYFLEYFETKFHFAGHYVTIYGYDETNGYLVDGNSLVVSSLTSIATARSYKGPMSSPNRAFTMTKVGELPDLKKLIISSINRNAFQYLHPPITNISYKGIRKTAQAVLHWLDKSYDSENIIQTGLLMDEGGTGGALFRNMYRDFLKESDSLYPELCLHEAYLAFSKIAHLWEEAAKLIVLGGTNRDDDFMKQASQKLLEIADLEEKTMQLLLEKTLSND